MRGQLHLERFASHGTRLFGWLRGARARQIYVVEFPKSGGSWLSDMLAEYYGIPRPIHPVMPIVRPAVIHAHWSYTPRLQPVVYLVRDVRDVVVSAYFRWLWEIQNPPYPQTIGYARRRLPVLLRPDAADIRANLPQFVREFAAAPIGSRLSWGAHVAAWKDRPDVTLGRYEELVSDTTSALTKLVGSISTAPLDQERLDSAVRNHSFQRRSGRARGVEDRGSFLRRGVAGDWRNHTSREAGALIDERFGATLLALGYESERDWWRDLPH